MRSGISVTVSLADRLRLEGVVRDRNAAQKHVWWAAIILLSAGGVGTTEIMRRTDKSKTVDPDQIIATVKRGYQALDSFH